MKKTVALFLGVIMLCSLFGCSDGDGKTDSGKESEAVSEEVTEATITEAAITEQLSPREMLKQYRTASTYIYDDRLRVCDIDDKWGYVDINGVEVIPTQYTAAGDFSEKLARVQKDEKWGFIDTDGNTVIPIKYNGARDFHNGLAAVKEENKWGFITPMGKEAIPFSYDEALDFSEGFAAVCKGGKWGYVADDGSELPFLYEEAKNFSSGYAAVKTGGKWGFIDRSGELKIDCAFDNWEKGFNDYDLGIVKSGGIYYLIGKDGKAVAESVEYIDFNEGIAVIHKDRASTTYVNARGEIIIEKDSYPEYVGIPNEGRIPFYDEARKLETVYDYEGNVVFEAPCQFAQRYYSEGLIGLLFRNDKNVEDLGYMTFYDKDGNEVFSTPYNTGFTWEASVDGLLCMWGVNGKAGFMDRTGNTVIEPRFFSASPFRNGLSDVRYEYYYVGLGLINKEGKDVVAYDYSLWDYYDGLSKKETQEVIY